eukprot:1863533-Alexandrium_andersonii.AAC.1
MDGSTLQEAPLVPHGEESEGRVRSQGDHEGVPSLGAAPCGQHAGPEDRATSASLLNGLGPSRRDHPPVFAVAPATSVPLYLQPPSARRDAK